VTEAQRSFAQVDVFSDTPYLGNPVAVVLDGDGLSDEDMSAFAAWTNLSETTFVQTPVAGAADYRLRIFTPGGELPFAGHPTLGSAHAWLAAGGTPKADGTIVQECGIGLVDVRIGDPGLSFRAPKLLRDGPLDTAVLDRITKGLRIGRERIVDHRWVDNGPGWAAVRLASADEVLALEPDHQQLRDLVVGVVGLYPDGAELRYEVRAFAGRVGVREDPVTGSLNAGIAQWLIGNGTAPGTYRVGQGTRVGRRGVITIDERDGEVWVGGDSTTCIRGTVLL
jgi:PhzF family phenazine biosynthesis protein